MKIVLVFSRLDGTADVRTLYRMLLQSVMYLTSWLFFFFHLSFSWEYFFFFPYLQIPNSKLHFVSRQRQRLHHCRSRGWRDFPVCKLRIGTVWSIHQTQLRTLRWQPLAPTRHPQGRQRGQAVAKVVWVIASQNEKKIIIISLLQSLHSVLWTGWLETIRQTPHKIVQTVAGDYAKRNSLERTIWVQAKELFMCERRRTAGLQ